MNQSTSRKLKRSDSKKQSLSAVRLEETDLNEKFAVTVKVPFECPRCHWIMRSEKSDDKHPIPSTVKPSESIADSDIVEKNYVCRNPKCQISFIVYWSDPRDFLNRI